MHESFRYYKLFAGGKVMYLVIFQFFNKICCCCCMVFRHAFVKTGIVLQSNSEVQNLGNVQNLLLIV